MDASVVDPVHGLFEHYRLVVDAGQSLLRIDKFLTERIANATRQKLQDAIKNGFVRVNAIKVRSSYKVKGGDLIQIELPTPPRLTDVAPESIPLDIVYEDDDVLVIDKPAGMVVHPAYKNWSGTLANALIYHFAKLPENTRQAGRPGIVHRLDKDTSGLLVVAKTEKSMASLYEQFYSRSIRRIYWALVWGTPINGTDTIDVPLGRDRRDRKIVVGLSSDAEGKKAVTHYRVLEEFTAVSLLECRLETGRTHQIRAHMKHIGCPVFSDAQYGGQEILPQGRSLPAAEGFFRNCFAMMPRQALHARSLGFEHPQTGVSMHFESQLPLDFAQLIEKLRKQRAAYEVGHCLRNTHL